MTSSTSIKASVSMATLRRELTSEEVTSKATKGININAMPGRTARSRNALTRAEAEELLKKMLQMPDISVPRLNKM